MTAVTDGIDLTGLTAGPAQTWGAIRLVPLLRPIPITELRLHARLYDPDEPSIVHTGPRTAYLSYIPHAFVATWTTDTTPVAAFGTQLRGSADTRAPAGIRLASRRRMTRREDRQRLRFLPLHLAMEGYLALQFGGPPIAWQEWTRHAVTRGLSPRVEASYTGAAIAGLDDALRVFEIHPDQCGMVLYVADALAAAFVVPHPDDYRALHPTLLQDFYGELLFHYTHLYPAVPDFTPRLDDTVITSVADLRAQLAQVAADWTAFHALMADGLLAAGRLTVTPVQRMGRFTLGPVPARLQPRSRKPHRRNHHRRGRPAGLPQNVPALGRPDPPGTLAVPTRRHRLGPRRHRHSTRHRPGRTGPTSRPRRLRPPAPPRHHRCPPHARPKTAQPSIESGAHEVNLPGSCRDFPACVGFGGCLDRRRRSAEERQGPLATRQPGGGHIGFLVARSRGRPA
ncbi:hypothetical protein GCM10011608_42510 [Micromonospora sonchi]|uniref:ARG and Rhodanese-Phosphatase-superfamily-associated domain-containing protein n=1 Tax=Micromonospora sonchi TaxID=1763543 RepID=A0A917U2E2_9ACTN|nr:hypothetical protein GCM10011608_42510 [Micromonospora sonchi]